MLTDKQTDRPRLKIHFHIFELAFVFQINMPLFIMEIFQKAILFFYFIFLAPFFL